MLVFQCYFLYNISKNLVLTTEKPKRNVRERIHLGNLLTLFHNSDLTCLKDTVSIELEVA